MATKKLKKKVQRKPAARKATNPVVDSARDFWLAGLGAFSYVQGEGMKAVEAGNKLFDQLVKEGGKIEKKARKDLEGAFGDIRSEIESRVNDLRGEVESRVGDIKGEVESRFEPVLDKGKQVEKQATQNWDRLEGFFEERVAGVLDRLGIPAREDLDSLNRRVQSLSRQVAALEKKAKPAAAKKPATKKPATKKPAAKKAPVKKAAVKKAAPKKAAPKAPEATEAPKAS